MKIYRYVDKLIEIIRHMLITTTRSDHLCGMKKISVLCTLIFTLIFPAGGCFYLKDAYTLADATTVDDISYCIKKDNDSESVVICSWWDGEATEIVYEIPDTFEGRDVVWLGDKASGFDIRQPSEYVFYDPDDGMIHQRYEDEPIADVSDESLEITDINVTFVLGENIEYIGTVGPSYLATGDKEDLSVYRVNLFFEISDDNPVYYSRDGVPYLRSNDEPVCTAATDLPDDSMSYELSYNEDAGATTLSS